MPRRNRGIWKTKSSEELARYCPALEQELRECILLMRQNKMLFDLEV